MSASTAAIKALQEQRYWLLNALDRETERISELSRSLGRARENVDSISSDVASIEDAIIALGGTLEEAVHA